MKRILHAASLSVLPALVSGVCLAQAATVKLQCTAQGSARHGYQALTAAARYSAGSPGFDLEPSPQVTAAGCTAAAPFFVSVHEPEGNYRVTVQLGNGEAAAVTAVKAEARRLMLAPVSTAAGKFATQRFVVNVRTDRIAGGDERVHLKSREIGNLDWDDKLTLEFTGMHPSVRSIEIEPVHVPTVYIAGDSTVVDQDKEPWAAWGQVLPSFFNDKVAIANDAESGETIRSFVSEKRFDKIMSTLGHGDYLLMQFAHNDQKPGRGFVSIPVYKATLEQYIGLARGRGAHPVLVTSMNRRDFEPDGTIKATLGDYPDAMREVARAQHVPLIDLNAMSKTLFEAMGPQGTLQAFVHYPANTFPDQPKALADNTHFNSYGALELTKCVVNGIREQRLPLAHDLRPGIAVFDPAHPDPPSVWALPRDPFLSAQTPYER